MKFVLQPLVIHVMNCDVKLRMTGGGAEKRKHGEMLPSTIRAIICGPSNSGTAASPPGGWRDKRGLALKIRPAGDISPPKQRQFAQCPPFSLHAYSAVQNTDSKLKRQRTRPGRVPAGPVQRQHQSQQQQPTEQPSQQQPPPQQQQQQPPPLQQQQTPPHHQWTP
ncbi:PREDICTED: glutenin, low molecular weight subunit-like [Trachymyrmex cornetzi]|uniref:glutenin, low molecular weight subunit-like n=1 Tax=Trachymyrmex cornetzi TaxID=471704 RepID=UPI00084EF03B|nr:PREDICTED: glutenin, low molecular weight subunit-like [Trachymyrmex cornetzi]